jgi:hypothetical protein
MTNDYRQAWETSTPSVSNSSNILTFKRFNNMGQTLTVTYALADGRLTRQVNSEPAQTLATEVGLLPGKSGAFERINPNTIFVNFQVTADSDRIRTQEMSAAWRTGELITTITTHGENQMDASAIPPIFSNPTNRAGFISFNGRWNELGNFNAPDVYGGGAGAIANPNWIPSAKLEF